MKNARLLSVILALALLVPIGGELMRGGCFAVETVAISPVRTELAVYTATEAACCDLWREDVPLPRELQETLYAACDDNGISRELGIALIDVESNFDPGAVSSCGCYGFCQLHPAYFPADLSPEENIRAGIDHLARQIERYGGDVEAGLTAYYYGHDTGKRGYAWAVLSAADAWAEK